jgi:hypothetical protein
MRIFIHKNETTWGPYGLEQLQELLQGGNIAPEDLAALEGGDQWAPLKSLVRIETPGAPPPPVLRQAAAPGPPPHPSPLQIRLQHAELLKEAEKRLSSAYGAIFIMAGVSLLFGVFAMVAELNLKRMFGSSPLMIGAGALYLVLGILVVRRSKVALFIALMICCLDALVLVAGFLAGGGHIPFLALAVRAGLIALMVQGFDAITKLRWFDSLR